MACPRGSTKLKVKNHEVKDQTTCDLPLVDVGAQLSDLFAMSLNFAVVKSTRSLDVLFLQLNTRLTHQDTSSWYRTFTYLLT